MFCRRRTFCAVVLAVAATQFSALPVNAQQFSTPYAPSVQVPSQAAVPGNYQPPHNPVLHTGPATIGIPTAPSGVHRLNIQVLELSPSNQHGKAEGTENNEDVPLKLRIQALEAKLQQMEEKEKEEARKKAEKKAEEEQKAALKKIMDEEKKKPTKPTFKIGGRVHFDSWTFPTNTPGIGFFEHPDTGVDPENRTLFRRIRLEIGGDIFDFMNYRMQVDFNNPSTPEIKDVYIGFTNVPWFQTILIGNQKRPLGLDHLTSSRFTVFPERPMVVEAFNEDARRIGIASYSTTENLSHTFRMGGYMLENIPTTGRVIGDDGQWSFNTRLTGCPWYENDGRNYLHWGVAGMLAHPDGSVSEEDSYVNQGRFRTRSELRSDLRWLNTDRIPGADWYEIAALEGILNIGPFQVVAEYQNTFMQRDSVTPGTGPDLHFHGAYVYVAYFLTGEHMVYDRKIGAFGRLHPKRPLTFRRKYDCTEKGWGALQVAYRYSYLDLSDNDILGGVGQNHIIGLNWYMTAYSSFQFNFIYGEIDNHRPEGGFTGGSFTSIGTRFRANF